MIQNIQNSLRELITLTSEHATRFFKTGVGEYSNHDTFIGITIPNIRKVAKQFANISLGEIQFFLKSKINEERMFALIVLVNKYKSSTHNEQEEIAQFYLSNLENINNWNLVDASAHYILGAYFFDKDRSVLYQLSKSKSIWERRVAIVSTFWFIKQKDLHTTIEIALILLTDKEDLIHKAVGWMLREAGKIDKQTLVQFLDKHKNKMPRTMLRYAIEKFPEAERKIYLNK